MNNFLFFLLEELEGTKVIKSYCFLDHTEKLCYSQPEDAVRILTATGEAKSVT